MERITLKAYAVKHKLSMFNVMKMVKSGQVKSEVVNEGGRDVTYILYDEKSEKEIEAQIVPLGKREELSLLDAVKKLQEEVKVLRSEIETVKKMIT